MLEKLKLQVFLSYQDLAKHGVVVFDLGSISAIDRDHDLVAVKPLGVSHREMTVGDMVVVDLEGNVIEGRFKPSSDTPTHLEIYKAFSEIGGCVHTHSTYATAWAQAGLDIPIIGTIHADYCSEAIPCTRDMTAIELIDRYEKKMGNVITERFKGLNPNYVPSVLVKNHGSFSWGKDTYDAVQNAVILEQVAKMACLSLQLNPRAKMSERLIKERFYRKHGEDTRYGQAWNNPTKDDFLTGEY